jgi:hypothetical protein
MLIDFISYVTWRGVADPCLTMTNVVIVKITLKIDLFVKIADTLTVIG